MTINKALITLTPLCIDETFHHSLALNLKKYYCDFANLQHNLAFNGIYKLTTGYFISTMEYYSSIEQNIQHLRAHKNHE